MPFGEGPAQLVECGRNARIARQLARFMTIGFGIVEFFFWPRLEEATQVLQQRKLARIPAGGAWLER